MGTQIIRLHSNDDRFSIQKRLDCAHTTRLLLVWPRRVYALTHIIDLTLLNRFCREQGCILGLVTQNGHVLSYANKLGIPVFPSIKAAQSSPWSTVEHMGLPGSSQRNHVDFWKDRPVPSCTNTRSPKGLLPRIAVSLVGVMSILGMMLYIIPSASVRFTPAQEQHSLVLEIRAIPGLNTLQVTGEVPLRTGTVFVTGNVSISTSGTVRFPSQQASGFVRFTNLGDVEIEIPKGTIVRTDGASPLRFSTLQAGRLGASFGSTTDVAVKALEPGEDGNIAPGSIAAIEGLLGAQMSVSNPDQFTGGSQIPLPAPSPSDIQVIKQRLSEQMIANARKEIYGQLPPNSIVFPETFTRKRMIEESFVPDVSDPANELSLHARAEYSVQYASGEDLRQMVRTYFEATLMENSPGYVMTAENPTIQPIDQPVTDASGVVKWQVKATQTIQRQVITSSVAEMVAGHSPKAARNQVMEVYEPSSPIDIRLSPGWWFWMPFFPARICIEG